MSDILKNLKLEFTNFNRNLNKLKNLYEKLKNKKSINEEEKNIFLTQLNGLKNDNEKLKILFSTTKDNINNDMSKITYEKIVKDYDNLIIIFNKISLDFYSIPVISSSSSSSTSGQSSSSYNISGNIDNFNKNSFENDYDHTSNDPNSLTYKNNIFIEVKDVDEEIIKERETEIKNIHKDITMLNDMYKTLSGHVKVQKESVQVIHDQTSKTEESAAAGLEQIKKASELQPTCIIS